MTGRDPALPMPDGGPSLFARILVPLDESAIAPTVFSTAVGLARLSGAAVYLLRVVTIEPAFPPGAHSKPDGLDAKLVGDAQAQLDVWVHSVSGVQFAPPLVMIGDPWRQILNAAGNVDADLIVMGSHRYHGVDRLLGTVAAKVANHADRNVLVVHRRTPAPATGPGQPDGVDG